MWSLRMMLGKYTLYSFKQWVCFMDQTRICNPHNSPESGNYYYPHFVGEEMRLRKMQ